MRHGMCLGMNRAWPVAHVGEAPRKQASPKGDREHSAKSPLAEATSPQPGCLLGKGPLRCKKA
jgi:hypothetical protein